MGKFEDMMGPPPNREDQAPSVQVGTQPHGATTGAPTRTQMFRVPIPPAAPGRFPVQIVGAEPTSRSVVLIAPLSGWSIFVSDSQGVSPINGIAITPLIPYEIPLPGNQALYATTDAPTSQDLQVQVAPLLAGDRERRS
jgi:hypothetical protein